MVYNSEFYCTCCGKKGLPVPRKNAKAREVGHLKKLYCIYCQKEVNHAEIQNGDREELEQFRYNFETGVYKEEGEQ